MKTSAFKTAIVYYSGHHGNTKKLAEAVASVSGAELIDVSKVSARRLDEFELIGFASGIYFSRFGRKVLRFAKKNLPTGKKVFFLYTCGKPSRGYTVSMRDVCAMKNSDYLGAFGCKGYDTFALFGLFGGLNRGHPDERDLSDALEFYKNLKI